MVSVEEASNIILSSLYKPALDTVPLPDAIGRFLGEEITADRDFPPFDRVAMDGIAIRHTTFASGVRKYNVEGVQAAGEKQKDVSNGNNCMEVMTGSMLPTGTDTVIRYEDVVLTDRYADVKIDFVDKGQNVHRKGQDAKQGDMLLTRGFRISPAEIALLASIGKKTVQVLSYPKTAIISTGDELVDVDENPLPHQIRRSNTYALEAAMREMNWPGKQYHLPDKREALESSLRMIASEYDVLILSGGVSKGKFDFIPQVLQEIGVRKLFHQVNQRPGKPFWFGASSNTIVFALPGNPVSTYMCFFRYIRPWFFRSMGAGEKVLMAALAADVTFTPSLTYFLPVAVNFDNGVVRALPHAGGGSGDFANLKNVDGFLELPSHRSVFNTGEAFPFIPFRRVL